MANVIILDDTDLTEDEKRWKQRLEGGAKLTKYGAKGKPCRKSFHLTPDHRLVWDSTSILSKLTKPKAANMVDLHRISRVQRGQTTHKFCRFRGKHAARTPLSFSVMYDEHVRSLDLVCDDGDDAQSLIGLLEKLAAKSKTAFGEHDTAFYLHHWRLSDKDQNGELSVDEVCDLVQRLNLQLSRKHIKAEISKVDANNDGVLQFDEFVELMRQLSDRRELGSLWAALKQGQLESIVRGSHETLPLTHEVSYHLLCCGASVFKRFLEDMQGESLSDEEQATQPGGGANAHPTPSDGKLGYPGFVAYMAGLANSAVDLAKEKGVYQDMDQPLCNYWCASSHNTYLEGDQLTSPASVNRYISDLSKGCRCVELDCWDGEDGQPVIYHGHTLTGRIKFVDVIMAVHEFAFTSSDMPVILSLENHCSIPQQQIMAATLSSVLGNMLAVAPMVDDMLPSPASLRNKVIIKGSKGRAPSDAAGDEGSSVYGNLTQSTIPPPPRTTHKVKVAPELAALTTLGGVKFKGWEKAKQCAANEMSSFSEPKSEKLFKASSTPEWIVYNQRQMSRIYPGGQRVDSSNYDPMPHWCAGSQIVALNYQTSGMSMYLNHGRFRDNGGCGYVLKPPCLQKQSEPQPVEAAMTLIVQVCSAQQLPKPKGAHKGEIIDPYVKVGIHGTAVDTKGPFQTHVISDNGFNPIWDKSYSFKITQPSLALLSLVVKDDGPTDTFIAYATIPVSMLKRGYRRVALFSSDGTTHGEFKYSSLMCRFDMRAPE
ncbi:PLC-like phosphodiesterase [Tribonema minus]|uniref:Phosphoinositide phospholipase C n=1 Tax=Tribonema minus TaxID=303371 RepID=A0A836C9T5_9STRA|nr:PLC-like phosphodiesterase [Tribonema minus]